MTCPSCGAQTSGSRCAGCGATLPVASTQGFVDPYGGVDWDAFDETPAANRPATKPTGGPRPLAITALVVSCLAVVAVGVVAWLLLGRGWSPFAATPAPYVTATEELSSDDTEPEIDSPEEPSAAPEVTVYATVTAAPQPTVEELTEPEATAGVQRYFSVVAGNPSAGWELLTQRRQQIEDEAAYREFWGGVSAASVSGCVVGPAAGAIACDLTTVSSDGTSSTSSTRLWLAKEDGQVKIDVAGGQNPEQLAAEERLEQYRQQSLAQLRLDGRWIVELSAKRPGISDPLQIAANGTHTFYFTDILALHESLEQRLPDVDVLLLRRADWGKQGRDLWFTIADPGGLGSKESAQAWCAGRFPELSGEALANQCTPRELLPPYAG